MPQLSNQKRRINKMRFELIDRSNKVFDRVELTKEQATIEYLCFADRVWKKKGHAYYQQKSVFIPLPAQDVWNMLHAHRAVPAGTPPKKFGGGPLPLLG